jgi:hypothetical protein
MYNIARNRRKVKWKSKKIDALFPERRVNHMEVYQELLLEGIPVSFLDESGQRATIFRDSLERVTSCRALAVLDGLGDFGGDFLLHFDVVEAVFHIEHSSVKVKGYRQYNLTSSSCQAKKVISQQKIKILRQNVRQNAFRL